MNFAKSLFHKFLIASVTTLMIVFASLSLSGQPALALTTVDSYVFKVNVSSIGQAVDFYQDKLQMIHDTSRDTRDWTQFYFADAPQTIVGVYVGSKVGTGEAALTFVVPNIQAARQSLISEGITVSPVQNVGAGVLLAYFSDDDGNSLVLRENT